MATTSESVSLSERLHNETYQSFFLTQSNPLVSEHQAQGVKKVARNSNQAQEIRGVCITVTRQPEVILILLDAEWVRSNPSTWLPQSQSLIEFLRGASGSSLGYDSTSEFGARIPGQESHAEMGEKTHSSWHKMAAYDWFFAWIWLLMQWFSKKCGSPWLGSVFVNLVALRPFLFDQQCEMETTQCTKKSGILVGNVVCTSAVKRQRRQRVCWNTTKFNSHSWRQKRIIFTRYEGDKKANISANFIYTLEKSQRQHKVSSTFNHLPLVQQNKAQKTRMGDPRNVSGVPTSVFRTWLILWFFVLGFGSTWLQLYFNNH